MSRQNGYIGLCYHYVRDRCASNDYKDVLGNSVDEFCRHVAMLKSEYQIITPEQAKEFSCGTYSIDSQKCGVLITFDDGLSDHYRAAAILAEQGIKAIFFIPSCILTDHLPANPTIIHYSLAKYRIDGFLRAYRNALEEYGLEKEQYNISYQKESDDAWATIAKIKETLKYKMHYRVTRNVLLYIYKNLLLKNDTDALHAMHVNKEQIKSMLEMGHSIGVHSHSHVSVAANELNNADFQKELLQPKEYLENTFSISIDALSYPFGEEQDCLCSERLIEKTNAYKMAFTIEPIVNTKQTHPLELGRYMPTSRDNEKILNQILQSIIHEQVMV